MSSFWMKKHIRLFWVLLVAISCFTLGYTVKPKADRKTMLRKMNLNAPAGTVRAIPPNYKIPRR